MKIVCVMAIHKRPEITKITLKRLKQQTFDIDIITVGDSEIEEAIATESGAYYVQEKNIPLGRKMQAGINFARQFDPTAVMIAGSDDWITSNWCEYCMNYIDEYDITGRGDWFMCNIEPGKPIGKIIKRGYSEHRYIANIKGNVRKVMVAGTGRMISRRILDKLNWQLYDLKRNVSLDTFSTSRIQHIGGKIKPLNDTDDIKVMAIKGPWESKSPYKDLKSSTVLRIYPDIEDSVGWLEKNYPGSLEDIKSIVPDVII